jgi:hypothetical protein
MTNENSDPVLPEGKPRALNILICVPALGGI